MDIGVIGGISFMLNDGTFRQWADTFIELKNFILILFCQRFLETKMKVEREASEKHAR